MFTCVVEIFGLPEDITSLPEIEVNLRNGACLEDIVAAMRRKVPALEGPVIRIGVDKLVDHFGFYVNGRYYANDEKVQLKDGDRIVLLRLATGG
jgi:molybdopterin converting factor small subunit